MRFIAPYSLATFSFFLSVVGWTVGVPIPSNGDGDAGTYANATTEEPEDQNESTDYMVIDDMIVRRDNARAGLVDAAWPNGIVPYTIAFTIAPQQRTQIQEAMKELSEVSCVKFRPATKEDTYNIEFRNDPMSQGCSSFVGWQNRKNQPVQLSTVCSKGNAIHEILHALGFFHEQTRNDRDEYVTINFQNIQPGFENNFKKDSELYANSETDYFGVPYNYDSIMHYGRTYFSKNGQNTIDVKESNNEDNRPVGSPDNLGQREFISEGDVTMLRTKYNCTYVEENETPIDNGNGEGEDIDSGPTAKPTTKNPMCQYNPGLPMCKQL